MNNNDFDHNTDLPWGFTVISAIALTLSFVGIIYLAFGSGRMVY